MPRILLVEDNEMNRDMLSRRLRRRGYEVALAVDGPTGVAMALTEVPDLVLMDMSLPILDGWEATRRLKAAASTKHIPVIALTAHAMAGDREKALAAGCDDYDTKPVELSRLLGKIQVLLGATGGARRLLSDNSVVSEPQPADREAARHALPSGLLHELRTPLNHIIGYTEMLIEQAQELGLEEMMADLQKTHAAGQQLLSLINDNFHSNFLAETNAARAAASKKYSGPMKEEPASAATSEDPAAAGQGRVLVVDDVENNRDVLSRRVERQGYTVATADDGRQALERLRAETFDLVLLDIMMPEMDGYEVLRQLKAEEALRHIPVIMISALSELDSVVRCIEMGAEDYLPKPFNPILLKARIGACLEKKRARDREQELGAVLQAQNREMATWRKAQEADLALARTTQQAIVTSALPRLDGWEVETVYTPLIQVGGDVYGWRQLERGSSLFWLADATGHGVAAALFTTLVALLFTHASTECRKADKILTLVNAEFYSVLRGRSFMTACCAVIESDGRLSFAGAGHPALLIRRRDGRVETVPSRSTMIGIDPAMKIGETVATLASGDVALLHTDGLCSLKSKEGERLTGDHVTDAFSLTGGSSGFLTGLIAQLVQKSGAQNFDDDLAAIALRRS